MRHALSVAGLLTERRVDPLGIDERFPRLSWRIDSDERSTEQVAYRVQIGPLQTLERRHLLWDSGDVRSSASAIPYAGPSFGSGQRLCWRVRVIDNHGCRSAWSPIAWWETGLLEPGDWKGRWIGYVKPGIAWGADESEESRPAPYLRHSFELDGPVLNARVYATALGLYELRVNGERVGSELLTPGWTDYRRRIQYQSFDVTALLRPGRNAIGAILGDGWYAGHMASFGPNHYGDGPALLCQLNIELAGDRSLSIASDRSWRAWPSEAGIADLLMGERVDGRSEPTGWDLYGFDDSEWPSVKLRAGPGVPIVAARDDGIHVIERLPAISIAHRAAARTLIDFGQNISGRLRVEASGAAGTTISIRHAEVLDEEGELYTRNLRSAEALDTYTFRGAGIETFEPRFTYHGFRYAEIDGLSGTLEPAQVTALAISSAGGSIGSFECSDTLVNNIHRNVDWGLRDNFVSIPTDCPQRDERLGWTADVQVFAASALFIRNVANTLEKWLIDLSDAQLPSGVYPDTAPHIGHVGAGNAGWADAGVLVPWVIWERTGERRVLERQYASMRRYLEYLEADQTDGIRSSGPLGDWLSLGVQTGTDLIGTAYLAWTSSVFVRIARILGEAKDAERFTRLTNEAQKAFAEAFVRVDGALADETQTGYALALGFGLLPEDDRRAASDRLASLVEASGAHLSTGFLGAPLVLAALSEHGHHELACRIVRSDTYPGWGYQVRHGATTIWERWNGWTPENGFADPAMNSFNHFAFGSVADWLHRYVAGLNAAEPGYRRVTVQPRPNREFAWARAHHESAYGKHAVQWELIDDVLHVTVEVPANTSADVVVPASIGELLVDGRRPRTGSDGVREVTRGQRDTRLRVGSGRYVLEARIGSDVLI